VSDARTAVTARLPASRSIRHHSGVSRKRRATAATPAHDAWRSRGFLLRLANMRWEREVSAVLRPLGLTYIQFALLGGVWWLESHGVHPSQRELSDHTAISPMLTSQVTRTLENAGLIKRTTDPSDTRIRRLELTAAGWRAAEQSIEAVDAAEARFFTSLAIDEDIIPILQEIAGVGETGKPPKSSR
jgi:DNA-binding MarR family transcriptional regulator